MLATWSIAAACSPAPAPQRAPSAPLAIGTATPPPVPSLPRVEAAPRPPDELTLVVRVANPPQFLHELASIVPPSMAAVVGTLETKQLAGVLLGKRLARVVDLAQPIDVESLGTGDPSFVVSMAVQAESEGRLGQSFVLREERGLSHVVLPDDGQADGGKLAACAFTSGSSGALTRLVCASDEPSLEAGAAYLARGVSAEPLDADVRLTLPGKLLREHKSGPSKAASAAAGARLGTELVERFVEEIDRIDVDLHFVGPRVEVAMDLRLRERASLLARLFVVRSPPASPPGAFFRLPGDAVVAMHTTGALPEDVAPLRTAMAEALEASLVEDGYPADKTRALREKIESLVLTGGPLVFGAGVSGGREGVERALAALGAAPAGGAKKDRAETQARAAFVPWFLLEVDEPPERWTRGIREIVAGAAEADRARKPGSTSRTPHDPDGDHVDVRVAALDPALKLPKDTLHLEVLLDPWTKGKHPSRKGHFFVVPKGGSTWIGYSLDGAAIASRMRLAIDDGSDVGTLARAPEAATLRSRPSVAAGLVSLVGFGYLTGAPTTSEELRSASTTAARRNAVLAQGADVIAVTASTDARPGSLRVSLRSDATRAAIADFLTLAAP